MKRTLSVFMLAMINVAAIGSVKNWPVTAEYGFSSIFFFLLASLIYFIPVSMVSAELATGWPEAGGIFVWVKEAFGHRAGFLSVWLLWVQNVVWYPTVLSFIAATIAFIFNPDLINDMTYNLSLILLLFWGTTFASLLGMKVSGWISSIGVVLGTFIPAALIIGLGALWFFEGKPSQIAFSADALLPDMSSIQQIVFFVGILIALAGMEMSAVHARDVHKPQKNYPRAILLSGILIIGLSILGVLAIAMVIPQKQISLTGGSMQAFSYFVHTYGLDWATPWMAALVAIGAFVSMSTWTVGPSKGLLAAARFGDLPPVFRRANEYGMPISLLIFQAIVVSLLSLLFLLMPSVNSAYWILMALVSEVYMVMYLLMFAAAIKLRYSKPKVARPYKIPGGNVGMWIVAGLGFISSFFAMIIGLIPPAQIPTGSTAFYVSFLIGGTVLICLGPSIILYFKKPSWDRKLAHEEEPRLRDEAL